MVTGYSSIENIFTVSRVVGIKPTDSSMVVRICHLRLAESEARMGSKEFEA